MNHLHHIVKENQFHQPAQVRREPAFKQAIHPSNKQTNHPSPNFASPTTDTELHTFVIEMSNSFQIFELQLSRRR